MSMSYEYKSVELEGFKSINMSDEFKSVNDWLSVLEPNSPALYPQPNPLININPKADYQSTYPAVDAVLEALTTHYINLGTTALVSHLISIILLVGQTNTLKPPYHKTKPRFTAPSGRFSSLSERLLLPLHPGTSSIISVYTATPEQPQSTPPSPAQIRTVEGAYHFAKKTDTTHIVANEKSWFPAGFPRSLLCAEPIGNVFDPTTCNPTHECSLALSRYLTDIFKSDPPINFNRAKLFKLTDGDLKYKYATPDRPDNETITIILINTNRVIKVRNISQKRRQLYDLEAGSCLTLIGDTSSYDMGIEPGTPGMALIMAGTPALIPSASKRGSIPTIPADSLADDPDVTSFRIDDNNRTPHPPRRSSSPTPEENRLEIGSIPCSPVKHIPSSPSHKTQTPTIGPLRPEAPTGLIDPSPPRSVSSIHPAPDNSISSISSESETESEATYSSSTSTGVETDEETAEDTPEKTIIIQEESSNTAIQALEKVILGLKGEVTELKEQIRTMALTSAPIKKDAPKSSASDEKLLRLNEVILNDSRNRAKELEELKAWATAQKEEFDARLKTHLVEIDTYLTSNFNKVNQLVQNQMTSLPPANNSQSAAASNATGRATADGMTNSAATTVNDRQQLSRGQQVDPRPRGPTDSYRRQDIGRLSYRRPDAHRNPTVELGRDGNRRHRLIPTQTNVTSTQNKRSFKTVLITDSVMRYLDPDQDKLLGLGHSCKIINISSIENLAKKSGETINQLRSYQPDFLLLPTLVIVPPDSGYPEMVAPSG
eukprot:sb/3462304/